MLIIDRHSGPSLQPRALGAQARTLAIYSHLGIIDRALELGKRSSGANMRAGRYLAERLRLPVRALQVLNGSRGNGPLPVRWLLG